jgi:hypothetical protein
MHYIYLLKAGRDHYKVGVATSVKRRVANMQTSNADRIETVTAKLVINAYDIEQSIHNQLKEMKAGAGNEWFKLSPEQALEIAILINKSPEIDISDRINLNTQVAEQRVVQKMIEKKLDVILSITQKQKEKTENFPKPETEEHFPKRMPIGDEVYMHKALEIFTKEGKGSTSLLQRRLAIGYGRAARIMDKLERAGVISEQAGVKPRTLLKKATNVNITLR